MRGGMFPMMAVLALAAACRDSSEGNASADNGSTALIVNTVENVTAPPAVQVATAPARPSPEVTVRAQPAPLGSLDLPPSPDAAQATAFPQEVTNFMVDRDSCDHFRGEEPYDGERRVFLVESIAELCTGTDAKLAMLRQRYANNPAVMAALRGYEDHIEGRAPN